MLGALRRLIPRLIRRSYAAKFAIALLVLGVSIGSIGIAGTVGIQEEVEGSVHDEHATLAEGEAQSLDAWNRNNEETVESLARAEAIQSGDRERMQAYIEGEMNARDEGGTEHAHLHYVDVDRGEVLASSMTTYDGDPVTSIDAEWFDDLEQPRETTITEAYRSGQFGGELPRIAYVTGESLPEGTVLVYTVPLRYYTSHLGGGDSGVAMVVDENDRVLFDQTGSSVFETYDEEATPLDRGRELDSGRSDALEAGPANGILESTSGYGIGQENYVVGYASVPGTDWVLLVHTPVDNAYGFVQDVGQYGIYASIAGVLLVGLVGAVIGWNTSRSIDRLTSKAERMEEGDLDVAFETTRIDSIGRLYDGFATMRDSLKSKITEAERAREEAERARAETERINRHLEAKADEYSDVMRSAGEGDLTARMDAESESEAMSEIGAEFNAMIAEIEETTAHLKAFANEVATASEEVTASSEEVRSASEQVTESVQEISDGADRQNESLRTATHEMNGLSTTTEQIAASSNQVADIAERTAETGQRGREAAQQAIDVMDEIEVESGSAVDEIERLEAEMAQIDELIEFIGEVAKETNMLALNANIEASRSAAGDEGFSVVAGEVKDLAEETKTAAEDIEERLERIQEQTGQTVASVREASARVSENREVIGEAASALDEIADYAEETNVGVQEISAATEQQAAATQEVVAIVDEAATISEETTAESENVAAAAEEQTTALTEVSRSASDLATQASQLSEALDRFETDTDPAVDDRSAIEEIAVTENATVVDPVEGETEAAESSEGDDGLRAAETATDESTDREREPTEGTDTEGDVFTFGQDVE